MTSGPNILVSGATQAGILTIADLKASDPVVMRTRFSVLMQRTIMELNGIPCIPMETEIATKQR